MKKKSKSETETDIIHRLMDYYRYWLEDHKKDEIDEEIFTLLLTMFKEHMKEIVGY